MTEPELNEKQTNVNDFKSKEQASSPSEQTLTLLSLVAVTNQAVANPEVIKEKEEETATLPKIAVVHPDSTESLQQEEVETATLLSLPAHENENEKQEAQRTRLWAASAAQAGSLEEEKANAAPVKVSKREKKVLRPARAQSREEPADHASEAEPLHTGVWPVANRTEPLLTALHASVSSSKDTIFTISRSRAILLTLLISFFNIFVSVFIVLALLYQLNGTLIYQDPPLEQEVQLKVMQLEQQANQLATHLELLENGEQLENEQEALFVGQIERLQDNQYQLHVDILHLQAENRQLQEKLNDLQSLLAEVQELAEEIRLYQSKSLR